MSSRTAIALVFALGFIVAVPACFHHLYEGSYKSNVFGGTYWIGTIGTTVPYVVLAVLFLAHYLKPGSALRISAYACASMSWLAMMAFSVFVVSQPHGPALSSTTGVAMGMTPFIYLPILFISYAIGLIIFAVGAQFTNARPAT